MIFMFLRKNINSQVFHHSNHSKQLLKPEFRKKKKIMNRLFKKQVGNYAYYNYLNKYEPFFLNKYQSQDHYKMGRK